MTPMLLLTSLRLSQLVMEAEASSLEQTLLQEAELAPLCWAALLLLLWIVAVVLLLPDSAV